MHCNLMIMNDIERHLTAITDIFLLHIFHGNIH